ncbi:MAG: multicopper oxidase domain-containing protein [Nitriliruptorales bacterium]|nr:multicopper oxidase domain-containing protein [Nitriliruptorales bacterium]
MRATRWLLTAAVILAVPMAGLVAWLYVDSVQTNVGDLEFRNDLAIPPLLEPTVDQEGRKVFDLRLRAGQSELLDGITSQTWGVNGDYLGPTLRAERGDDVAVNVVNALDEPTSMHWHGMHLPAEADGGPHQPIAPGATWSPTWSVDQPAASLWYHPHLHESTADHVYRGLAGMFIIDDPQAGDVSLPETYGVDDIPLIIQDKQFHADGSLDFTRSQTSSVGILGDEILVNGTHDPLLTVHSDLVRLRVLNASNARIYDLGFTDDRLFWQVASDSGLLPAPHETRRILLSPGERAELVVAFDPGDDVVLRSYPPDLGSSFDRLVGGEDTFDLLRIVAADELEHMGGVPERLAEIEPLTAPDAEPDRTFALGDFQINGQKMDMARIDEVVAVGATEVWEVSNASGDPHNFHVHDVHFQILSVDGAEPPPHLVGWKDTVFVPPGTSARIVTRFRDYTDSHHPYMFHCHILAHEDGGMMGQFTVVDPADLGTAPRQLRGTHEHQ